MSPARVKGAPPSTRQGTQTDRQTALLPAYKLHRACSYCTPSLTTYEAPPTPGENANACTALDLSLSPGLEEPIPDAVGRQPHHVLHHPGRDAIKVADGIAGLGMRAARHQQQDGGKE